MYQCIVKVSRFAQNRNNWSSARMIKKNLVIYLKELSQFICLDAINQRRYNPHGDIWIHDLKLSHTNMCSTTIRGTTGYIGRELYITAVARTTFNHKLLHLIKNLLYQLLYGRSAER